MYRGGYEVIYTGRAIVRGIAEGEAIVSKRRISFLGDVDPETGEITDSRSDIYGENISGKVLVFPGGRGSTVGSYVIYRMKKNKTAPSAMINLKTEPIIAVGAVIAGIPLIDSLRETISGKEIDPTEVISTGNHVYVNSIEGWVRIDR